MSSPARLPPDQTGFTLIELLTIVVVTCIFGVLAVTAYQTHSIRTQVKDGIRFAEAVKEPIMEAFRTAGEAPADRHSAGMPADAGVTQDTYVSSIDVVNGRIDVTYGNRADEAVSGRTLSLTPYETPDLEVIWVCGNEIAGLGLKPLGFFGGGNQAVHIVTTVEPRYLPSACR